MGVGTKFSPVNANQTTNVMTWNAFATKSAAMKVLANDVNGLGDWPLTNLNEIMPDGWKLLFWVKFYPPQVPYNNEKKPLCNFYRGFFMCS